MTGGEQTARSLKPDLVGVKTGPTIMNQHQYHHPLSFQPTKKLRVAKPLTISTYNVRTLYQKGKLHQLMTSCSEQGIDIVGIQEHRLITNLDQEWSDDGQWLFAYASATHERCGGVGILLRKESSKHLR